MAYPEFNPDEVAKQSDDQQKQKMWMSLIGQTADNLANAGSDTLSNKQQILTGQKYSPVQKTNFAGTAKTVGDSMTDPWEKQKKTYEMYKAAKEGQALDRQSREADADDDPNSPKNKALDALLVSQGKAKPEDLQGLSYKQKVDLHGNPGKLEEIKAQAQMNFENEMAKQKAAQTFQSGENAKNRANEVTIKKLAIDADNKNLPQNVYTAATYGRRLEDANKQMDDLMTAGYNPASLANTAKGKFLPEFAKSEDMKLMDQAQRNFVNAVLRRESGSAISASEFDSANKQYFPQAGDSDAVLAQKKRNREVALAGLKTEGAKAWNRLEGNLPTTTAGQHAGSTNQAGAANTTPVKKEYNAKLNKTRITMSDGSVQVLDGRQ